MSERRGGNGGPYIGPQNQHLNTSKVNPMISCITPTSADRNEFLPLLLRSFLLQDYPDKELIVVSEDKIPLPDHPHIRLVHVPRGTTIGNKRNIACANARGAIIAHFDSDDYSAPHRLTQMAELMQRTRKPVVGYNSVLFHNTIDGGVRYWHPWDLEWSCGLALVYTKSFWQQFPFQDIQLGEDLTFVQQAKARKAIVTIDGCTSMVALDHSANTDLNRRATETCILIGEPAQKAISKVFPPMPKVILSILTWNTKRISVSAVHALVAEKKRLESIGLNVEIVACDNGSTDGTQKALGKFDVTCILNEKNMGISVAKNQIIDRALERQADFVFFSDGDIEVVPWSILQMMVWLYKNPTAGCIGPWYDDCTSDHSKMSPHWVKPIQGTTSMLWAPCGYGLFPCRVFEKCRFDHNLGPGWGVEDNDLAAQMCQADMKAHFFRDMCFLHTHAHSAITSLKAAGIDVVLRHKQRVQYLTRKWAHFPEMVAHLNSGGTVPTPEAPIRKN